MLPIRALALLLYRWWRHCQDRKVEVYRALCPLCLTHVEDDPNRETALARVGHHIMVDHDQFNPAAPACSDQETV